MAGKQAGETLPVILVKEKSPGYLIAELPWASHFHLAFCFLCSRVDDTPPKVSGSFIVYCLVLYNTRTKVLL